MGGSSDITVMIQRASDIDADLPQNSRTGPGSKGVGGTATCPHARSWARTGTGGGRLIIRWVGPAVFLRHVPPIFFRVGAGSRIFSSTHSHSTNTKPPFSSAFFAKGHHPPLKRAFRAVLAAGHERSRTHQCTHQSGHRAVLRAKRSSRFHLERASSRSKRPRAAQCAWQRKPSTRTKRGKMYKDSV